jgi:hypothetical protein
MELRKNAFANKEEISNCMKFQYDYSTTPWNRQWWTTLKDMLTPDGPDVIAFYSPHDAVTVFV